MPPIFLTGLMGSGKSTVGRRLASRTGAVFVDHDDRIERMYGRTVAQMFDAGEDVFRACEHASFVALLAEPAFSSRAVVVATGGGLVLDPRHRTEMAAVGRIVWLHVPVSVLVERLASVAATRPLLAGSSLADRLATLAAERETAYRDGALEFDGTGDPDGVAERVRQALGLAPDQHSPS